MMLNQERWAEALKIEKAHRHNAERWVLERTTWLALLGDMEGVARMRQVASLLERLRAPTRHNKD